MFIGRPPRRGRSIDYGRPDFPSPVRPIQPELRHLRAFLAVAEQGSANRAGAALFRAQSAVSRSIHKLERELGVKLFERRARGMLLTEYGRALLVRARRVHTELQRARTRLLPESIAGVVAKYPGLRIATMEGSFEALAASLRAGDVDFILGALRPPEYASDLVGEPLADDELGIVSRRGHPWANRK